MSVCSSEGDRESDGECGVRGGDKSLAVKLSGVSECRGGHTVCS